MVSLEWCFHWLFSKITWNYLELALESLHPRQLVINDWVRSNGTTLSYSISPICRYLSSNEIFPTKSFQRNPDPKRIRIDPFCSNRTEIGFSLYCLKKPLEFGFLLFFFGVIDSQSSKATRERETTYKKVEGQHTLISLLSHHYLIPILYYHQFKDTWPTQKRHKTTGQILGHSVLMQNCRSIHQNSTMYVILYDSCINKKFKYSEKENSEFNYYHAFYIGNVYTVRPLNTNQVWPWDLSHENSAGKISMTHFWLSLYS